MQIDRIASQAPLFASPVAIGQISSAATIVQKIGNETEAFDPPSIKDSNKREEAIKRIETLPDKLSKMQRQLINEARRHLGSFANFRRTSICSPPNNRSYWLR